MNPTQNISLELLDNASDFEDPFFQQFKLRHNTAPLQLNNEISKNYLFPTFYSKVSCSLGIFFCDYKKAKSLLPHPSMQPVSMLRNRALVIFSCYEYKKVLGIAPYNEIAMTIPVLVDRSFNPPILPLLNPKLKGFGYYVFSMPVTSLENQIRGTKIWGLPKLVEQIDISINPTNSLTEAYDEQRENYFSMNVPIVGKETSFDEWGYLYSMKEDRLIRSKTNYKGNFRVQKFTHRIIKSSKITEDSHILSISKTSPRAKKLLDLEIDTSPLQMRFSESISSCFDLPE